MDATTNYLLSGFVGAIFASLITVGITIWNSNRERRRRIAASHAALQREIELCAKFAQEFSEQARAAPDQYSPLYRLPNQVFLTTFPLLLESAALSDSDSYAIIRFYNEVDTLNRGIDDVSKLDTYRARIAISQGNRRNIKKSDRLTGEHRIDGEADSDLLGPAMTATTPSPSAHLQFGVCKPPCCRQPTRESVSSTME